MGATSEHFSNEELSCHGEKCGPEGTGCHANECTPELVDGLEKLRALIGKPILINDAFRCREHNAETGGVPSSQHLLGNAADIHVEGMTARILESYVRFCGVFKGIGRDDERNYVHVDVRPEPAQWTYNEKTGKQQPYFA